MIYTSGTITSRGLAKTPAGRAIDRTRSAPGRGFVRPMEPMNHSIMRGCFRASSAPRARSHRDKSARGATIQYVCSLGTTSTRENIRVSLHRAHVASVRAGGEPRRRLNNSHDDDANEWFVRNIDETSTRMDEFNRTRESGASLPMMPSKRARAPPRLANVESPPIDPFGSLRPPHPSSSPSFSATFTRRYFLRHELR